MFATLPIVLLFFISIQPCGYAWFYLDLLEWGWFIDILALTSFVRGWKTEFFTYLLAVRHFLHYLLYLHLLTKGFLQKLEIIFQWFHLGLKNYWIWCSCFCESWVFFCCFLILSVDSISKMSFLGFRLHDFINYLIIKER